MKLINQSYEICKTHGYTLQDEDYEKTIESRRETENG